MRILVVTNYYPPYEVGGYEQLCRDVALRLSSRGHTTAILTSDRGMNGSNKMAEEPGIHRLLRTQPQTNGRLHTAIQFFLTRRRTEAFNRTVFERIVQQFEPDVVFIWNLQGLPQELALDAEALPDTEVVYWLAGYTPAEPDQYWRYWNQPPERRSSLEMIKGVLRRIALAQLQKEGKPVRPQMRYVAVVSEYMLRKGIDESTLPPHAEVIYNGVETDLFYRPVPPLETAPPFNLLLAGRVSADKGIHVAVEAVVKLAQLRPQRDFRLLIAGGGPSEYVEQLKRLAANHNVTDLISFLGHLPRENMPPLMHASHILILTAIHPEAFARVVLEGMAAGLAVVSTLTGGTSEILKHEITGLACMANDSTDLAYQLGRLLDDPKLRYELACEGQKVVLANYTIERMVDRLEMMLEQAVTVQNLS